MAVIQVTMLLMSSLLLMAGSGHSQSVVSQEDEDRAIDMIGRLIRDLERRPPPGQPPRVNNPTAKLIRLVFHDCVSSGGCDGCLEMNNIENRGLEGIFAEVNSLYDREFNDTGISRADFYALASIIAVRRGANDQDCMMLRLPPNCERPVPDMTIRYGRTDCATSPNSPADSGFPDAHGDLAHVMEIFRDRMGMTERQVVALIGAHTMGMTTPRNSGFQGPWAPPTDRFDNAFFRTLVANNSEWHQSELNFPDAPQSVNPRYQWDLGTVNRTAQGQPPMGVNVRMMLNTDMALFKQVSPDSTGMETDAACRDLFTDCPPSTTADIALEYARNNTKWHEDFGPAFQILIENGYSSNQLAEAVDLTASTEEPTQSEERTDAAMTIKVALLLLMAGAIIASVFQ